MKIKIKKTLKLLLFMLIVAGCIYVLKPGFTLYAEHRNEIEMRKAEIEEIKAERVRLEEREQRLENKDPELIERLAREKLHLRKPDETVFKFKTAE